MNSNKISKNYDLKRIIEKPCSNKKMENAASDSDSDIECSRPLTTVNNTPKSISKSNINSLNKITGKSFY